MSKKTLYILDLDRTLTDVEKVMQVTEIACDEFGVNFKQIYKDQKDLQARGTAYSPFKYISEHADIDIEAFKTRFCELATNKLLFDDAADMLKEITNKKYDFMLLTHGVDDDWQRLKMTAAGLIKYPHIIIKDRYKSKLITMWIKDGKITPKLDGLNTYDRIVFVDDRVEAFADFPSEFGDGYLLDRFSRIQDDIKLPTSVTKIRTLKEVVIS